MRKKRLDPKVIRPGDTIRILVPKMVVRVGYPKTVKDYYTEVENALGEQIDQFLRYKKPWPGWHSENQPYTRVRAIHQLAYAKAKRDCFGGSERSVHTKDIPEYADKIVTVVGVRSVRTGIHYPPSGSGEDYEPGGLSLATSFRLIETTGLELELRHWRQRGVEFLSSHVEKIMEPEKEKT